jgi:hypothetical protein
MSSATIIGNDKVGRNGDRCPLRRTGRSTLLFVVGILMLIPSVSEAQTAVQNLVKDDYIGPWFHNGARDHEGTVVSYTA